MQVSPPTPWAEWSRTIAHRFDPDFGAAQFPHTSRLPAQIPHRFAGVCLPLVATLSLNSGLMVIVSYGNEHAQNGNLDEISDPALAGSSPAMRTILP